VLTGLTELTVWARMQAVAQALAPAVAQALAQWLTVLLQAKAVLTGLIELTVLTVCW
jgi:hypothetical protein